jgi:hypothetical protein
LQKTGCTEACNKKELCSEGTRYTALNNESSHHGGKSQKYNGKFPKGTVPTKATTYRMTEKFYAKGSLSGTTKTQNVNKSLELV